MYSTTFINTHSNSATLSFHNVHNAHVNVYVHVPISRPASWTCTCIHQHVHVHVHTHMAHNIITMYTYIYMYVAYNGMFMVIITLGLYTVIRTQCRLLKYKLTSFISEQVFVSRICSWTSLEMSNNIAINTCTYTHNILSLVSHFVLNSN